MSAVVRLLATIAAVTLAGCASRAAALGSYPGRAEVPAHRRVSQFPHLGR